MIDLIVFRGSGDREGSEVFDPLLSSVQAALQRGKFEIDFNTPKIMQTLEVQYDTTVRQGSEVSIADSRTGEVVYGVVKDFSHVVDGPVVYTKVDIEVPQ